MRDAALLRDTKKAPELGAFFLGYLAQRFRFIG